MTRLRRPYVWRTGLGQPVCDECGNAATGITKGEYFDQMGAGGHTPDTFPIPLTGFWHCTVCDRYGAKTIQFE